MLRINTNRLELIASTAAMVRSEMAGDGAFSHLLDARIAAGWPNEHWDRPAMEWTLRALESVEVAGGWGMWYWVLTPPAVAQRTLIGNGGFKGPPSADGVIEIGYSIVPEQRRRGLATEACLALMTWALRDPRVRLLTAETFPHLTPSIGVMRNLGMVHLGDGSEPGTIRYGVLRESLTP